MTLITAEPRFFFSLSTYAALSRFITSRHSSPFDFWSHFFLGYSTRVPSSIHLIDFSDREQAAMQRQHPLFPFVQHGDDLTGSRMPASALPLSQDFIN